jgi:ABC-type transport system involved in multi-copper enzyme maturation permease subunit
MASRAIKPKREISKPTSGWHGIEERAPSVVQEEGLTVPRIVAILGLMLIVLGGFSIVFHANNWRYLIPAVWGFLLTALGIMCLLFHAFYEQEFQLRRLYGFVGGFVLFGVAAVLRFAPFKNAAGESVVGLRFLPYGALALTLSLGFLLCFVKNESDKVVRSYALNLIGFAAVANALAGFIGGLISEPFLLHTGVLHLIFGLLFAGGYVGMEGASTQRGFWAGCAIGIMGAALFLVALGRSFLPWFFWKMGWAERPQISFFLPQGLILMYIGLEYLIIYLGVCSDNKLVVLTRRELSSFFCSPIAYIVLIGMAVLGWGNYWVFLQNIFEMSDSGSMMRGGGGGMPEPIFQRFALSFLALIPMIFIVPVITMRMISEEKRTGTLEVLLTVPVNEWQIVLSKFLAGLRIFMLCWYLWMVFFIPLRVEGGQPFDYRPIITFLIALLAMGTNFIAMGVFFSSLTRHQIVAAVFTFVVVFISTLMFILLQYVGETAWAFLRQVTYVDLWWNGARGVIVPRLLVLHLSFGVFWLFLTTLVLGARKWS